MHAEGTAMKKPWVVSLLSVIPGLGLIALGQVVMGLGVMAGMALLIFFSVTTPSTDLSTWLFVFALILWMLQLGYALLAAIAAAAPHQSPEKSAQREARRSQREAEAIQRSASETLTPLLLPSQHLRIALNGMGGVDPHMLGKLLLALLGALGRIQPAGDLDTYRPITSIGITEDDLVFTTTRRLPQPSDLRRVPLRDVSLVEFKERRWGLDKLVLHAGKYKLLCLHTAQSLRPAIRELAAILRK
jgi:hypothetical protein